MKNLIFVGLVILFFASNSFAKLVFVPLGEAVENSDLIIVGTLENISEKHGEWGTKGEGEITVDKFISGNIKTKNDFTLKSGDKLQLNYVENFACVMGSHRRIENEKGIFLLNLNDNGEIESKDFRSLDDLAEIRKLLKKGTKPNATAKTIKLLNELEETSQDLTYNCAFSDNEAITLDKSELNQKTYSQLQAFLVILFSIFLYYVLYRSRFKIR